MVLRSNYHHLFLVSGPFMLSMLEKIKANAATLSKPQLGEAPLNLSAMLDNGHTKQNGSEGSSGNSGKVFHGNKYCMVVNNTNSF